MRGERIFEPGERVRVAAPRHATFGRLGTVVEPDDAWPLGPCVLLDGDVEPAAFETAELEPAELEPGEVERAADERAAVEVPIVAPAPPPVRRAVPSPRVGPGLPRPAGAAADPGADMRLARAVAALILEERARTEAVWQARLDAAKDVIKAEAASIDPALDRDALVAVLACAEEYVSGAPLNRALVLHALRSALVRLGARPGEAPLVDDPEPKSRREG